MRLLRTRWNICFGFVGFVGFLQVLLHLSSLQAFAEALPSIVPVAKVVSIEGAKSLAIRNREASREVQAGSFLEIDETDGTQWNRLKNGMVRGLITKPPIPLSKAKFLIRTRAAILGVRGTDFVMTLDPVTNAAQVHTLEGSVEVALNEEALLRGKGTVVGEGKFVDAASGKIEVPESFNKGEFLKSFDADMPSAGKAMVSGATGQGVEGPSVPLVEVPLNTPKLSLPLPEKAGSEEKADPEEKPPIIPIIPIIKDLQDPQEPSRFRLVSFRLGAFFTVFPNGTRIGSASVAWTPTLPVPFLSFLTLRGNLGLNFAQNGSLSAGLLIREYQVFLNLSLLQGLFVEAGIGRQIWNPKFLLDGQLLSLNAGILLPSGLLKSMYVGYQYLDISPRFGQFKAGIEIFLF
jgi:hypothetical protein